MGSVVVWKCAGCAVEGSMILMEDSDIFRTNAGMLLDGISQREMATGMATNYRCLS